MGSILWCHPKGQQSPHWPDSLLRKGRRNSNWPEARQLLHPEQQAGPGHPRRGSPSCRFEEAGFWCHKGSRYREDYLQVWCRHEGVRLRTWKVFMQRLSKGRDRARCWHRQDDLLASWSSGGLFEVGSQASEEIVGLLGDTIGLINRLGLVGGMVLLIEVGEGGQEAVGNSVLGVEIDGLLDGLVTEYVAVGNVLSSDTGTGL